jgi:cation diffusion facilitator family transporter
MPHASLRKYLLLSIAAAVVTIGLKATAYLLTNSVGLLSDAVESLVNLVAAVTAYLSLLYAALPEDRSHTYGHGKIEFFSSGLEGSLIVVAALGIAWYAVQRLLTPRPLEPLGPGLAIAAVAAVINGGVGLLLIRIGRAYRSIVAEADGRHLLTDFWTSAAVLAGLGLVWLTDRPVLDPIIALAVSANILWTAGDLLRRSFNGLMDHALPPADQATVRSVIEARLGPQMDYHALRTRQAGTRRFVDFHLLVPGQYTVKQAHALTGEIEAALRQALPDVEVTVHIEPIEERAAWEDSALVPLEQQQRREEAGRTPAPGGPPPAAGEGAQQRDGSGGR